MKRSITRLCAWSIGLLVLLLAPATAAAIDEFPAPGGPSGLTSGPDGALWFTEETGNKIGRMTTGGAVTNEIPVPTAASLPGEITVGPDGKLWFTEFDGNKIGRVDSFTTITDFSVTGSGSQPDGIVAGPTGALWFTEFGSNQLGRMDVGGTVTDEYSDGGRPRRHRGRTRRRPLVHRVDCQQHPPIRPGHTRHEPSVSRARCRKRPVGDHLVGWSALVHGVRFRRDRPDHHGRDHHRVWPDRS